MTISRIKGEMEYLSELGFCKLNGEQKQHLRNNFNSHVNFEYAEGYNDDIIFICSEDAFNKMEYYLGFEYERECMEYKFFIDNKIIVSYSGSERVENLIEALNELEENED
jgi:hypothetical protein